MSKENRRLYWIVFFVALTGIFLKLLLVFSLPVYHDVGWYISLLEHHDSAYMNLLVLEHPPFGYYPYLLFLTLFGADASVVRFAPFLFSLIELALIYFIAKKWFNKRVALYGVLLFSLTYFSTVNALSPEGDGSIMGFFSLLLFYCWYEHYNKRGENFPHVGKKMLLFTGIFLGILFLIKIRNVLFILPLCVYSYYKTRNAFASLKDMVFVGVISILLFFVFPALVFLVSPNSTTSFYLLKQVVLHNTGDFSLLYKITHPLLFLQVLIVLTLLFPFLMLKGLQNSSKRIHDALILVIIWFFSLFAFLLLLLPEGYAGIYPRYIAFLVPPLVILAARGMEQLWLSSKTLIFVLLGSFSLGSFFLYLNQHATAYWYLESAAMGIVKVSTLLLVSIFSVSFLLLFFIFCHQLKTGHHRSETGLYARVGMHTHFVRVWERVGLPVSSGYSSEYETLWKPPVKHRKSYDFLRHAHMFGVHQWNIQLKKCKITQQIVLFFFLITCFSFNFFLITEPLVDKTHTSLLNDLVTYYEAHRDTMKKPIFIWAEDLAFYFGISGKNIALFTNPESYNYAETIGYNEYGYYYMNVADKDSIATLKEKGGTVFSFYYPLKYTLNVPGEIPNGRQQEYAYLLEHCLLLRSFDYVHAKAVIFEC